jgi:hypothetical protein
MKRNANDRTTKLTLRKLTIAKMNTVTGGLRYGTSDWTNCNNSKCGTCDSDCTDCC